MHGICTDSIETEKGLRAEEKLGGLGTVEVGRSQLSTGTQI